MINWTGGVFYSQSTSAIATTGVYRNVYGGQLDFSGVMTNAGNVNIISGDLRLIEYGNYGGGEGLLVNQTGGTVNFHGDTYINDYDDGSGFGSPSLINYGTVTKSAGTGTSALYVPLNNSGTVNAQTGSIAIENNSVDNPGGILTVPYHPVGQQHLYFQWTDDQRQCDFGWSRLDRKLWRDCEHFNLDGRLLLRWQHTDDCPQWSGECGRGEMSMDGILTNAGHQHQLRRSASHSIWRLGSGPGLLINQSNGTVNFPTDTYINYYNDGSGGSGPPMLINYGTVVKSGGTGTSTINPPIANHGMVNAQTGAISSDGGGEGDGLFRRPMEPPSPLVRVTFSIQPA